MVRSITAGVIAFGIAMAAVPVARADRWMPADPQGPDIAVMAGSWAGEARIAVNWTTERTLRVNTSGSQFGGKESMWLAARDLRLARVKVGQ